MFFPDPIYEVQVMTTRLEKIKQFFKETRPVGDLSKAVSQGPLCLMAML